jgi:hypothetical protein
MALMVIVIAQGFQWWCLLGSKREKDEKVKKKLIRHIMTIVVLWVAAFLGIFRLAAMFGEQSGINSSAEQLALAVEAASILAIGYYISLMSIRVIAKMFGVRYEEE